MVTGDAQSRETQNRDDYYKYEADSSKIVESGRRFQDEYRDNRNNANRSRCTLLLRRSTNHNRRLSQIHTYLLCIYM